MSLLFEEFKTICFHLNRVGITPTLMGSLGLEFRTKEVEYMSVEKKDLESMIEQSR